MNGIFLGGADVPNTRIFRGTLPSFVSRKRKRSSSFFCANGEANLVTSFNAAKLPSFSTSKKEDEWPSDSQCKQFPNLFEGFSSESRKLLALLMPQCNYHLLVSGKFYLRDLGFKLSQVVESSKQSSQDSPPREAIQHLKVFEVVKKGSVWRHWGRNIFQNIF